MLTIYTTCRDAKKWPFYETIQYNSVKSWTLLEPRPKILIIGNDPGSQELAEELNVTHIPDVKLSENGIPILPDMIRVSEENSICEDLLLCSSDIILFQDTIHAYKSIKQKFKEYCGVVAKFEKTINHKIDFSPGWEQEVKTGLQGGHPGAGDYFLYTKGFWEGMPDFVIGRCLCDTWMFGFGRKKNMVNMNDAVTIIHQSHEKLETNGRGNNVAKTIEGGINYTLFKQNPISGATYNARYKMHPNFSITP